MDISTTTSSGGTTATAPERLTAAERRESLLDAALALLRHGGEPGVTIGSVAERADVTRALVYKHFDNRDDLVIQLYRREAARLDLELIQLVEQAPGGFEPKMRALVRGLLDSTDRWGTVFVPLRDTAAGPVGRRDWRTRHRRTIDYFATLAIADYRLPPDVAPQAVRILLGGLDPLMWMVRPHTPDAERQRLVDLFLQLQIAALCSLGSTGP